jgi:hypothetical protein
MKIMTDNRDMVRERSELPADAHESAELILDEAGMILDCTDAGEDLFECSKNELVKQHISKLLPQLSKTILVTNGALNSHLSYICRCGYHFLTRGRRRGTFFTDLNFVILKNGGRNILRLIVRPYEEAS